MTATFTENWYDDYAVRFLGALVRSTADVPGRVIEVGCWEGKSTIGLANAAYPTVIDAVDTWAGSPGEVSEKLAAERDVYATFCQNIASATRGNVTPHRCDWRTFFDSLDDPIRLCHIDATHSYNEVFDNIQAARKLLSPGGVICGDDALWAEVSAAVNDTLGASARQMGRMWWAKP